MAGYVNPIPSGTGGIAFSRLPADEIKRISVKRIHATPTLDSLLNPVPGGLYDPALGAIKALDVTCTTCRMSDIHCAGHCGHIELPVACYHPQYIETTLRLLRSKCLFCHKLRLPRQRVRLVIGQLLLLQLGLVEEYEDLKKMQAASKKRKRGRAPEQGESVQSESEDVDVEDLMEQQDRYVRKAIRKAKRLGIDGSIALIRNPAAVAARKEIIGDFLREVAADKKCKSCQGITPNYRKDRSVKIFKMPLSNTQRDQNTQAGLKAVNPLLFLMEEEKQRSQMEKPKVNGWHQEDEVMLDVDDVSTKQPHGAEEEIALRNALETAAEAKTADLEDEEDIQQYMTPTEVRAALDLLFSREQEIMRLLFVPTTSSKKISVNADMFFMTHILVPPNKFRPAARQGAGEVLEASQNGTLNRIINAANDIHQIAREMKHARSDIVERRRGHNDHVAAAVLLQEAVNGLIDHAPNPNSGRQNETGIKQTLEKKEGLFRMNMMGKRVNFAARSVISPDPNIETNEIGVPLVFARKLTYPEPVTSHNFDEMSRAVVNGLEKHPGAAAIENERGQVLSLKHKTLEQRKALAKQLLTPSFPGLKGERSKKVHRHLQSGDVVVMNRQPTLHKPSMMGHRARVLQNEKTIRMHYANCNTYNADFDGDEMNMHFPQNELARAEAFQIADTDHQYLSATAGKPLRGLIQDHLSMGVQFCSRDVFFDRDEYQELLYSCLRPEDYHTIYDRIQMVQPAILKPKRLWTGKQIISTLLKNIVPQRFEGLNLVGKSSTSSDNWGEITERLDPAKFDVTAEKVCFRDTEQVVIFKDGEHLCGILDKAQLGPSVGGLVHSLHELYGHIIAGKFLSILGRLLTRYLAKRAWTCGMDDLYLTNEGENNRRVELSVSARLGKEVSANYVTLNANGLEDRDPQLLARLEGVLRHDDQAAGLDQMYNSQTKTITENVTKACLPDGLRKPFPRNQMQAMTISGAKGSNVNASLISCNLGQQVLEGRRVPIMVSGKTLPSFREFETDPVAGGYISGRFLTGIKPQEYFFHAMSGREGLIDTAVKTSKSGYLQRCIVKGLEGLKTEYDTSVREASNGTIVQFLYGEDGLEITKQKHLTEFTFLAENSDSVAEGLNIEKIMSKLQIDDMAEKQKSIIKSVKKNIPGQIDDPLMATYGPARNIGSTSESFAIGLAKYLKENSDKLIRDKKSGIEGKISKKSFQRIMELKYLKSLVDPGEAVGVVAAQSVGEPSTQMTLNTFHLAGHSSKNVTLGIPRLREIVMTASANISTPTMSLKPIEELSYDEGVKFAKGISRLAIAQVVQALSVTERAQGGSNQADQKIYDVLIELYPPQEYMEEYAIQVDDVDRALRDKFIPRLTKLIKTEFRKKSNESALSETTAAVPDVGVSIGRVEEARPQGRRSVDREGGEDDADEDADPDDAKQTAAKEREEDRYDEPDEDEVDLAEATDDSGSDDEGQPKQSRSKSKPKTPQTLRELEDDNLSENMDVDNSEDEERLLALQNAGNPNVKKFLFTRLGGQRARLILGYPSNSPKILLLPILEKAAHDAVIQSIPGIKNCVCLLEAVKDPATGKSVMVINEETGLEEEKKESVVTTEGVNLKAIHDYQDVVNPHSIYTNSVNDMLKLYGVEAARVTIIREIDNVFKGHGISVDNRHLNLIADAMTQSGGYKAFSRNGIVKESGSVLGKMSFETVMGFLKDAVLFGEKDPLLGPSARIVAGRRGRMGTGSFDVVVPVH